MNRLLIGEIGQDPLPSGLPIALQKHIESKIHPAVRAASISAWRLVCIGAKSMGLDPLPEIAFEPSGKPYFPSCELCFSLSHSRDLAAVLLSTAPCAVDLEWMRPEAEARLSARVLSPAEQAAGVPFFEAWTQKECIGKLSGQGLTAHPARIDTLDPAYAGRFFSRTLSHAGQSYMLTALCMNATPPEIIKNLPEEC